MRNGDFHTTHQGICFSETGDLIDGQHRLLAIVEAGLAVEIMVTRGMPDDSWHALDIGVKRSLSDITAVNRKIVEPLRYMLTLIFVRQPTFEDLDSLLKSRIGQAMNIVHELCPQSKRLFSGAPIKSMAALQVAVSGSDYAAHQYHALVIQDYSAMTPYVQSFCKQLVARGGIVNQRTELACRAFMAFDESSSQKSRIQLTDRLPITEEIRSHIKTIIKEEP